MWMRFCGDCWDPESIWSRLNVFLSARELFQLTAKLPFILDISTLLLVLTLRTPRTFTWSKTSRRLRLRRHHIFTKTKNFAKPFLPARDPGEVFWSYKKPIILWCAESNSTQTHFMTKSEERKTLDKHHIWIWHPLWT